MTGRNNVATPSRGATWGGRPRREQRGNARRWLAPLLIVLGSIAPAMLGPAPASASSSYDPGSDPYSMEALTENTGAAEFWNRGYTGAGIDVAVIDTGVMAVEGLATPGKIVHGPDLSLESQSPQLTNLDTNGHGTFIAGVIAGKDSTLVQPYAAQPATSYRGIAPDARIISLKVGSADGGVDVTQMIAAINWVVDHKNDNGMNIRVLNLSYGTNSNQSYIVDPLAFAAERAWRAGIVVVAAAGNTGYQRGNDAPGLANPAYNPFIIAAGGYDTLGTVDPRDDVVGAYSASSSTWIARKPDFVAVGSKVQGLRVPGSFIDTQYPGGQLGDRYFRGSGTSEAAAVASGTVALILQQHPSMSPDEVKRFMRITAQPLGRTQINTQGQGALDLRSLVMSTPPRFNFGQWFPASNGLGSVELSRGDDHLSRDGVVLAGEIDIFGHDFAPGTAGSSWSGGQWNGSTWSGSSWSGSSWSGSTWSGSSWSGSSWSGSSWSGSSWSGSSWSGSSWSGSSWSGSSWSGGTWATGSWS